jgi:hypothetical protein
MDRVPEENRRRYELLFPSGLDGPAFLSFGRGGQVLVVALKQRHARLLMTLKRVRKFDSPTRHRDARGWRTRRVLAELLGETGYHVEPETISAYCSQIMRRLRDATPAGWGETPPLIERQRGLGVRLADVDLEIVVGPESTVKS